MNEMQRMVDLPAMTAMVAAAENLCLLLLFSRFLMPGPCASFTSSSLSSSYLSSSCCIDFNTNLSFNNHLK
jgi:hypothetical protein